MTTAVRNREVAQIDAYLTERKRLKPGAPEWKPSSRPREVHAIWHVEDSAGVERAHLRFRCHTSRRAYPTIMLILGELQAWRVDLVPPDECKFNPPWAYRLGLPAMVCGPHGHEWSDNRDHLLTDAPWKLPCRRPMPVNLRRIPQVLPWLAESLRIELSNGWRGFDIPPQADLFSG